jgi:hypothetical protein
MLVFIVTENTYASGAAFALARESKLVERRNLLMLRSDLSQVWTFRGLRAATAVFCLLIALAFIPSASAQTYTLGMNKFQPFAIAPSQTAASSVILSVPQGQTSPGPVDLSCSVVAVSPTSSTVNPECSMSPSSVTPPGGATATINTVFSGTSATPGAYTVTVTGTLVADGTTQTQSQPITVLAVTGQFNLSISTVLAPSSVPAGSGAQATISVNPVNSYSGNVTLACASITPLVISPPVCSFAYQGGGTSVAVSPGAPGLVTLTISTVNKNTPITANSHPRLFYAFWLPAPLALIGIGAAARKRSRRTPVLLALFVLCAAVLLIPACSRTNYTTPSTSTTVTPSDTYTITLVGTDQSGNISTNTGTTTTTLTLTVTAPTS